MRKWLVIYDIRDARRLQKVARVMKDYGQRVQKSVFEVEAGFATIERMRGRVLAIMDDERDYVVYFNICESDWQKKEKYGPQKFDEEPPRSYYIY